MEIVVKEKMNLDEMARQSASHPADGLPFRVIVNAPDHLPAHAHLMDWKTGTKELGQFLIPDSKPKTPDEIKDYKTGVPENDRNILSLWMRAKSKWMPKLTNYDFLFALWRPNEAAKMKWEPPKKV